MKPDQIELDSLTGYENTHSYLFSLLCAHTCLDAFICLTIFLHPAQVQETFAEGFIKGSGWVSMPLTHRIILVNTPLQKWHPWVHLKPWGKGNSASEVAWITFPQLLECQCISVRDFWLMLHNSGTDSWPWLQISLPLPQLSCQVVKWPQAYAINGLLGNNVHNSLIYLTN